jgi:phytoene/squalene synthetase
MLAQLRTDAEPFFPPRESPVWIRRVREPHPKIQYQPAPTQRKRALAAGFRAAAPAIHTHQLPVPLLEDLLSAFAQDVEKTRDGEPPTPTRDALLDYCRRSANPVGRLAAAPVWRDTMPLALRAAATPSAPPCNSSTSGKTSVRGHTPGPPLSAPRLTAPLSTPASGRACSRCNANTRERQI